MILNGRLGRPVEVLNLGYRGLDLPKLLEPFGLALALEADVVVYAMVLNDADRSDAVDRRWPRLNDWIMVRRPIVSFGRFDSRLKALVADRYETLLISRDTTAWYQGLYAEPNRDGWESTKAHVRSMKQLADAQDVGFAVMLWPLLVDLDGAYRFEEAHRRIGRVAHRNGISFLDLLDTLRGHGGDSLWAHPADLHPNEIGHRLAAEALAPIVEALLE